MDSYRQLWQHRLVVFQCAIGLLIVAAQGSYAQNPFETQTLDAAQSKATAPASGEVTRDGGNILRYEIKGVKDLKSFTFTNMQAWNLPGRLELEGEPDGNDIAVSGSIEVASSGFPGTDAASYVFGVRYVGRVGGKAVSKTITKETVHRPFRTDFDFSIDVDPDIESLNFWISFREDTGPENPMPWSLGLYFSIPQRETSSTAPTWTEVKGVGKSGAMAVAAAAVAIAVAAAISAKKRKKKLNPRKTAGYVLQLSKDLISLTAGQTESVEVTAWRVSESGATTLASDAEISAEVDNTTNQPPNGLSVSPNTGKGKINISIGLFGEPKTAETRIKLLARTKESSFSSSIRVKLDSYSIEFF